MWSASLNNGLQDGGPLHGASLYTAVKQQLNTVSADPGYDRPVMQQQLVTDTAALEADVEAQVDVDTEVDALVVVPGATMASARDLVAPLGGTDAGDAPVFAVVFFQADVNGAARPPDVFDKDDSSTANEVENSTCVPSYANETDTDSLSGVDSCTVSGDGSNHMARIVDDLIDEPVHGGRVDDDVAAGVAHPPDRTGDIAAREHTATWPENGAVDASVAGLLDPADVCGVIIDEAAIDEAAESMAVSKGTKTHHAEGKICGGDTCNKTTCGADKDCQDDTDVYTQEDRASFDDGTAVTVDAASNEGASDHSAGDQSDDGCVIVCPVPPPAPPPPPWDPGEENSVPLLGARVLEAMQAGDLPRAILIATRIQELQAKESRESRGSL